MKKSVLLVGLLLGLCAGQASAIAPPSPVIEYCDPYGSDPDCLMDDQAFEADYGEWYDYGLGGSCFDLHGTRRGTFWRVHYARNHVCVAGGQVIDFGSPVIWAENLTWAPFSWFYGLDWQVVSGPNEPHLPSDYASSAITYRVRFCSWVRCGTSVYPFISLDVAGWGGVFCYSDRGPIAGCRGRI